MRVLSGIQPTGTVHLGNYFGALRNWIRLQDEGNECFYSIVNQHAITIPQDPSTLKENTLSLAATLYATGLDPDKSTIFIQSDVPEHAQLSWVLQTLAPMGQMERMIQFKEKSQQNPQGLNLGLFSYPVLQAADILLYKPTLIPVGIDQAQHLELTRMLAQKFNAQFSEIFPIPQTLHTQTTKVVGLDGSGKMSKSKNNYIGLIEEEEVIWKKLSRGATDPARIRKTDPGNPLICNIFSLHKLFSPTQDIETVMSGCTSAQIGCIDCKKILFEHMMHELRPIREKYLSWMSHPEKIREKLAIGAEKARSVAQKTLHEVYEAIGFSY